MEVQCTQLRSVQVNKITIHLCRIKISYLNEKFNVRDIFACFSSDGQRILSCGADQCIRVLDVQTGTELYLKDLDDEIRSVFPRY